MIPDEKKFQFAVVGHSYELANAVQRCVNPETEELITRVVNAGEGVSVAKQLVAEGTEIIFGHMGNAQLMLQEIGQPVVEIPRTHLDMMIAFKKANAFGSHIGLTSFACDVISPLRRRWSPRPVARRLALGYTDR